MLKFDLTYTNVDGEEVTLPLNFTTISFDEFAKLSQGELAQEITKLSTITEGNFSVEDIESIYNVIDALVRLTYGKRKVDEDGPYFEQNPEQTERFMKSDRYTALKEKFFENPEMFTTFINGIIPPSVAQAVRDQQAAQQVQPAVNTINATATQLPMAG